MFRGPEQGRYEPNTPNLDRLVKYYGTTDDPMLGGFILPDGSFLDFSEGFGSRSLDHRNIAFMSVKPEGPRESRWDLLERICKRVGMYRWMPESWALSAWTPPTREQVITITALSEMRELILDIERGRKGPASRTYDTHYHEYNEFDNPMRAVEDLVQFYR